MTHELKVHPREFEALDVGDKRFEFRKNDRDFKVGDRLNLVEFKPDGKGGGEFTGRETSHDVSYVLYGPSHGVPSGYCVMSLT